MKSWSTALILGSTFRDKIGLISRLTENTMQNEWLLERARARA